MARGRPKGRRGRQKRDAKGRFAPTGGSTRRGRRAALKSAKRTAKASYKRANAAARNRLLNASDKSFNSGVAGDRYLSSIRANRASYKATKKAAKARYRAGRRIT